MKTLESYSGLGLWQLEEKYKEVKEEFEKIGSLYSGLYIGFSRRSMREEHQKALHDCIKVLFAVEQEVVQHEDRVRHEAMQSKWCWYSMQDSDYSPLSSRILQFAFKIGDYLVNCRMPELELI